MQTELLAVKFMKYFRIVMADTDELRREAYKIRYKVYCDELNYEDKGAFPDGMERDGFDSFSDHILLAHKNSQTYAGTVRLVRPSGSTPGQILAMEKFCSHAMNPEAIEILKTHRDTTAEVSRLAVTALFRRRTGEVKQPFVVEGVRTHLDDDDIAHFPYIAIGLYLACAAIFMKELDYILVMMEPRLARHMGRVGILFQPAGEMIDYHGQRAPFYITPEIFSKNLKPHMRALYEAIEAQLLPQLLK